MSAGLGKTQVTAADRARALVAPFAATAAAHDRAGTFPFDNFTDLRAARLLALRAPERLGGDGAGLGETARIVGLVAQGEPATALVLAMHYIHNAAIARSDRWPSHLVDRVGREADHALINALRVEPEQGSPARGGLPATTATRRGDGWHLSGRKIYSTGSPILSWYLVWARTSDEPPQVGQFLVHAGLPGTRIEGTWDHVGLRASASHDIVFEDVVIPLDHAVDLRTPTDWTPDDARQQHVENGIVLAALYDGVGRAARDWLISFLKTRVPSSLGKPLSTLPRSQDVVGHIQTLLRVNARLIDSFAADADAGASPDAEDAHVIKSVVTGNVVEAIELALSLTGNHGLTRANPLERHYRDALCGRVHTPQDDSVRAMLGRAALA